MTVIANNVKTLRAKLKWSQQRLAEKVGVSQATISRWEKGLDVPEDIHIRKLARLAHVRPSDFRYGNAEINEALTVPVIGYIGAGESVITIDDHPQGQGIERVSVPPGMDAEGLVALKIRGDSMRPLRPGWSVYYRRDQLGVPDECINQVCVVQVLGGPLLVKEVRRGYTKGKYNLLSWAAGVEPMEDQTIEWAALVVAILP